MSRASPVKTIVETLTFTPPMTIQLTPEILQTLQQIGRVLRREQHHYIRHFLQVALGMLNPEKDWIYRQWAKGMQVGKPPLSLKDIIRREEEDFLNDPNTQKMIA